MDKRKAALTIGKLFGTAIALSIVLFGTILIESLQASVRFSAWAIEKLNEQPNVVNVEVVEVKAITPSAVTIDGEINLPVRYPVHPNLWMIRELPRDYLNVKSLKVWAKDRQIRGYSKMLKAELIRTLS